MEHDKQEAKYEGVLPGSALERYLDSLEDATQEDIKKITLGVRTASQGVDVDQIHLQTGWGEEFRAKVSDFAGFDVYRTKFGSALDFLKSIGPGADSE